MTGVQTCALPIFEERITTAIRHGKMILDHKGEYIGMRQMRPHLAWYIKGLPRATEMRVAVNKIETFEELQKVLWEYAQSIT